MASDPNLGDGSRSQLTDQATEMERSRDAEALAGYASALTAGIDEAIAPWVVRSVERIMLAWVGEVPEAVRVDAEAAAESARRDVSPVVRELLALDIDDQRTNPLAVVRTAVVHPTDVLRRAGVPPVRRDEFAERQFPDDDYDLTPGSFAELAPELHEPGLVWGAAKAHVHLRRRRGEGKR